MCSGSHCQLSRAYGDAAVGLSLMYGHLSSRQELCWKEASQNRAIKQVTETALCDSLCYCTMQGSFCLSHTQQFVECVSCSGAIGLRGQQRVKDDFTKPLQAEGDPAGKETYVLFCF